MNHRYHGAHRRFLAAAAVAISFLVFSPAVAAQDCSSVASTEAPDAELDPNELPRVRESGSLDDLASGGATDARDTCQRIGPDATSHALPSRTKTVQRPRQMPTPAEAKAQKATFEAFGRYDCGECEGGQGYDAWVRHFLPTSHGSPSLEDKIAAMGVGDSFQWQGKTAVGSLTIVGDEPVGGFACKQVQYKLQREQKSAERRGLFCLGKSSQYSARESWQEVY